MGAHHHVVPVCPIKGLGLLTLQPKRKAPGPWLALDFLSFTASAPTAPFPSLEAPSL